MRKQQTIVGSRQDCPSLRVRRTASTAVIPLRELGCLPSLPIHNTCVVKAKVNTLQIHKFYMGNDGTVEAFASQ